MVLRGTFFTVVSKDEVIEKLNKLNERYDKPNMSYGHQNVASLKAYCRGLIDIIDTCFAVDLRAVKRCRASIEKYIRVDDPYLATFVMSDVRDTSANLLAMVKEFIPLDDFPTCKPILDLSVEDALSVANDLSKNTFTKVVIGAGLLGKKIGDVITISDVKSFYKDQISRLESEIAADRDIPSPTEEFLLAKFRAELGYCRIAMVKTGIGATKEIIGLISTADEAINRYEEKYSPENYHTCPIRLQD